MKPIIQTLILALAATAPFAVSHAAQAPFVGDSGSFGPIDTDRKASPRPKLVFASPKTVDRGAKNNKPIYLRVPPEHAKSWGKHCQEYQACDRPAYFVADSWYNKTYIPAFRAKQLKPAP